MSYGTKKRFIETILATVTELTTEQEAFFRRGLITETKKIEEITAIIEKAAEMLQAF